MRHIDNWDAIEERQPGEFANPIPGAYIAMITGVKDIEEKEYLEIQWDFAEGEFQNFNQDTYVRAGFWPTLLRRSYKDNAMGYFKGFKESVEKSNPGYVFDDRNVYTLQGKRVGVILGEEEYQKKNGTVGKRLYVYQTRSINAIHDGDFKIPDLKRLTPSQSTSNFSCAKPAPANSWQQKTPAFESYGDGDDGDLPF